MTRNIRQCTTICIPDYSCPRRQCSFWLQLWGRLQSMD